MTITLTDQLTHLGFREIGHIATLAEQAPDQPHRSPDGLTFIIADTPDAQALYQ
jgi:hypothetical protein